MDTLRLIGLIAGEGSKIGKAAAIAQATISTVEGTINAFKTAADNPITTFFLHTHLYKQVLRQQQV